jgi:HAD superfamily phosphoserine phosphatase-like hydrolase
MTKPVKIAAFDVCGTIYSSNTTFDFLKYYFKNNEKYLTFSKFINTIPVILLNKALIFFFKKDLVRTIATSYLKNVNFDNIEIAAKDFVTKDLKDKVILPVIELINRYKDKGYEIVLISGSYDFIVKYAAEEIGADVYFASILYKKNGRISGKYKEDLLYKKKQLILSIYTNIERINCFFL